ncbi:2-amino-4-hydroxy-6-hydroxymethyldihydropteridine diphosphokinase [Luteolibacter flavescens]|uniref:2-amino-4-hydroxy-6-hydroxymethyldihydropteridine pyrophosphokinase n=1 Tax=Luteolibacter flavescens TaxID=1859460 RepID=A0ABT3FQF6_9BACT|nr:2-amino-4-hydroxy-6-hydroxymethyldihydropteridine diphosphokinase [Luteolibacter flavescens]MCW1885797.1 2-amino-4-hydroxy-6-hydroxymethyldihydropteridine diphosphokinase [Luteolibacter flavescens]
MDSQSSRPQLESTVCRRVGIALGSNLGNRLRHLQDARDLLGKLAVPGSLRQAPVYQTEPVACPDDSPDFYNTVVTFDYTGGTPHALLDATQAIEFRLGRVAAPERNAPRVIDVDILFFGAEQIDGDILDLPHPRLTSRRFVLQPLADLHPGMILPGDQVSIAEHLRHLDSGEPPLVTVQEAW